MGKFANSAAPSGRRLTACAYGSASDAQQRSLRAPAKLTSQVFPTSEGRFLPAWSPSSHPLRVLAASRHSVHHGACPRLAAFEARHWQVQQQPSTALAQASGKHTIMLMQTGTNNSSRTFREYDSPNQALTSAWGVRHCGAKHRTTPAALAARARLRHHQDVRGAPQGAEPRRA